ncbi:MAG: serine hydrolase [Amphiplicatus sp.]|nr:serine hydrolase [Amphiplicatus sp.]
MNRQTIIIAGAVVAVAAVSAGVIYAGGLAHVGAAYKAKTLCSEIFLAGRAPAEVDADEFAGISPAIDYAKAKVDAAKRSVDASLFGLGKAHAIYRDGIGCTVEAGGAPAPIATPAEPVIAQGWPEAKAGDPHALPNVDYAAINAAIDAAFSDDAVATRSILVAVDGRIVAERYAPNFNAETPFLSWSMAKSVTASLVGAAVLRGFIDPMDPAPVPEWKDDAKRSAITWNDLLRMQSGLEFDETYGDPASDVARMLFASRETGAVAADKPLEHAPGDYWYYSSGTTNLIARTLTQVLEARGIDYYAFARDALFAPLGAASFTLEPDSAGYSIGSSYIYATARDWARLGELYLEGGVWKGERLLPETWPAYVSSPTKASDGEYGAQFWLNHDGADGRVRWVPGLPDNVYSMSGHEGQYVFIIPDKRMVIVRTGITREVVPITVVGPTLAAIYDSVSAE